MRVMHERSDRGRRGSMRLVTDDGEGMEFHAWSGRACMVLRGSACLGS